MLWQRVMTMASCLSRKTQLADRPPTSGIFATAPFLSGYAGRRRRLGSPCASPTKPALRADPGKMPVCSTEGETQVIERGPPAARPPLAVLREAGFVPIGVEGASGPTRAVVARCRINPYWVTV